MSNFSRLSRNRRRIGSQSYIVRAPHSFYCTVFSCSHRVTAFVMAMVIARTVDHRKTLRPEVGFWRWEADVRASRALRELICADLGDRGVSLSPPNRWGNWNSEKKKKRLPFPSYPVHKKLGKDVKDPHQKPKAGYFLRLLLFPSRWWVSSGSFVPLLISKLWLRLPLFPLCPVSIWLCNFYLPAFVLDIMIRQHLIWCLVLIYFSGTDPRDQLKGTTHS